MIVSRHKIEVFICSKFYNLIDKCSINYFASGRPNCDHEMWCKITRDMLQLFMTKWWSLGHFRYECIKLLPINKKPRKETKFNNRHKSVNFRKGPIIRGKSSTNSHEPPRRATYTNFHTKPKTLGDRLRSTEDEPYK